MCGYEPRSLYEAVRRCWEDIFDDVTSKCCASPDEWPILFGIVLQAVLQMAIEAGGPNEESGLTACACAAVLSSMDEDSF